MTTRNVRPLADDQLALMTAPRLHAYRRRLLGLEESLEGSDLYPADVARLDPALIYFKSDPRWHAMIAAVKDALARRDRADVG